MTPASGPVQGRCGPCGHVWTVASLPLHMGALALACARATCPACGGSMSLSVELDGSPAAAVATLESAALFFLKGRRAANPDQPFVDFRPISVELGIDHDTTRAILRRLKERGAVVWKWDFDGGFAGVILEGGGFASTEEGAA